MKCLSLFLILTVASQPLQAGFCGMGTDHDSGHQSSIEIEGPDETEQGHDHGGSGQGAHDCCETQPDDPGNDCGHGLHCGFCTAGVLAFSDFGPAGGHWPMMHGGDFDSGALAPSHSAPPYRPPIA